MSSQLRCDLVLEQTLGHITHAKNLRRLVPAIDGVEARFLPVEFAVEGAWARIPGWNNWTVRAGVRARRRVRRTWRAGGRPDAMFVHSQVPAVLLGRALADVPTVISLDATPRQYDELGEFYAHDRGPDWAERAKFRLNRRCYERAAHIVTWSEWARQGLADDYGVALDRITAIAPGVDIDQWRQPVDMRCGSDGPLRILFVGGDLHRKGGDLLLEVARRLRNDPDVPPFELDLVTTADIEPEPHVVVHRGLTANSPELIACYHAADVFCLPTLGDCLPMVLAEAAAAGLPLVSTDVGAIHSIVHPGKTGELLPVGDGEALAAALRRILVDDELRSRYGRSALELAVRDHDARANTRRIVDILRHVSRV